MKKIFLVFAFSIYTFAQTPAPPRYQEFTINAGQYLSNAVVIRANCVPAAIVVPSNWVTANMTFQVSEDGGTTFHNLKTETNTEVQLTVGTPGDMILLSTNLHWLRGKAVKIRSGTSLAPVIQTATNKVIRMVCALPGTGL